MGVADIYSPIRQPIIHEVSSVSALNCSVLEWYNTVVSQDMDGKSLESLAKVGNGGWADVRDVAEAHVLALEKEAAGGERIIVSAGTMFHGLSYSRCLWYTY